MLTCARLCPGLHSQFDDVDAKFVEDEITLLRYFVSCILLDAVVNQLLDVFVDLVHLPYRIIINVITNRSRAQAPQRSITVRVRIWIRESIYLLSHIASDSNMKGVLQAADIFDFPEVQIQCCHFSISCMNNHNLYCGCSKSKFLDLFRFEYFTHLSNSR